MVKQQCIVRIRSAYPYLSEKEKKIADFALKYPEELIHSSINQVSERLQLADATVFRFCKRLGFKGFQEMKITLASEVSQVNNKQEKIFEADVELDVAEKIFRDNIRTLEDTLNILDSDAFKEAVRLLSGAEKVVFFGVGGSGVVAQDAFRKFVRTGLLTYVSIDAHFQLIAASQLNNRDVAVFISHSDTNKQLLKVAKVAHCNHCSIVGITGYMKSPISQYADVSLHTASFASDHCLDTLASRAAQLTLIDALFVNVMKIRKEKSAESLQRMHDALAKK